MADDQPTIEAASAPEARLGPYRLERRLGSGGMGEVYLATDTRLHRRVAIKRLTGAAAADRASQQRFETEARTASSLNHPHICAVFDVGEEHGRSYLVMELLEGETLRARLSRGPLPVDEACTAARQIADALEAAHQHGIIHRDIKPENIFLTPRGVKVVDFGIAKVLSLDGDATTLRPAMMTREGTALGTVAYMSPEQARGEAIDARSDLFSLGVTLYEMICGQRPFRGATDALLFDALLNKAPAKASALRPETPVWLDELIGRLLAKSPADRPRAASEVIAALGGLTPRATPIPTPARRMPVSRRVPWAVVAAALVGIAVLSIAAWRLRAPAGDVEVRSLAMLPVRIDAGNPLREAMEGFGADVVSRLSRRPPLRTLPMTQTAGYASSAESVSAIGGALQVDALLTADVASAGSSSQLTASLVETSTGRILWSRDYTVTSTSLFDVERRLVADLTTSLGMPPAAATPSDAAPANPEAYDLFLRARYHAARVNAREIDQAIGQLERATMLDPSFAPAHALLAFAYGRKVFNFNPDEPELIEKGFAAVARALALNPNSAEALAARGELLWQPSQGFPSRESLASYRAALAIDPDLADAWHNRSVVLFHVGHLDAATRAIQRAIALNPTNGQARFRLAPINNYRAKYAEALTALQTVPREAYPANWVYQKAIALIGLQRYEEARNEINDGMRVLPNDQGGVVHSARALLAAVTGNPKAALADAAEAERIGSAFGHFHHTAYTIATVHAVLGDFASAQRWLERTANEGFPCYPLFENDPLLARLREQPSFQAFLARLRAEWEHIEGEE